MPVINLFLWRHAEAEDTWPDFERRLTVKGQRDAARVAKAIARQLDERSCIVASPAVRTRETAAPLISRVSLELALDQRLAPGAEVDAALDVLEATISSCNDEDPAIVLIGHQPWIGQLARHLLTASAGDLSVKKAAVWWLVRRSRDGTTEWTMKSILDPDLV